MTRTGPLWPDAPRYANAGAMMHDWILSGEWLHPYRFARENYTQFPAFSVPYHPPAFPALFGLVFLIMGVSYVAARAVMGILLGLSACFLLSILRRLGVGRPAALGAAALLLTTPEVVRWSRDTMSEVPALCLTLAATYLFLAWLERGGTVRFWGAIGVAGVAFFCRVTAAGVLPAWFLYAALRGQAARFLSPRVAASALLYLFVAYCYASFAAGYSHYEMELAAEVGRSTWRNLDHVLACLWPLAHTGTAVLAALGLALAARTRQYSDNGWFWASWSVTYACFMLAAHNHVETRYFINMMPALAGLSAPLFAGHATRVGRIAAVGCLLLGLLLNVMQLVALPPGMVGYDAVARRLSTCTLPGNVLLACPDDQELIFRYRSRDPGTRRQMVRADRTLAIRLPDYAGIAPTRLARVADDVLDIVRRGRIRYVVSAAPANPENDDRTEEMVLAHDAAHASGRFELLGEFPLSVRYGRPRRHYRIFLWEYAGKLPKGPSELDIVIPTAGLEWRSEVPADAGGG